MALKEFFWKKSLRTEKKSKSWNLVRVPPLDYSNYKWGEFFQKNTLRTEKKSKLWKSSKGPPLGLFLVGRILPEEYSQDQEEKLILNNQYAWHQKIYFYQHFFQLGLSRWGRSLFKKYLHFWNNKMPIFDLPAAVRDKRWFGLTSISFIFLFKHKPFCKA